MVDKDWLDLAPESAPREIFLASAVVFAAILVVLVAILPLLVAISVVFAAILFLLVAISAAFVAILALLVAMPVVLVLIWFLVAVFRSKDTLPSSFTIAIVLLPLTKFSPFDKETVLAVDAPLAVYAKLVLAANLSVSTAIVTPELDAVVFTTEPSPLISKVAFPAFSCFIPVLPTLPNNPIPFEMAF